MKSLNLRISFHIHIPFLTCLSSYSPRPTHFRACDSTSFPIPHASFRAFPPAAPFAETSVPQYPHALWRIAKESETNPRIVESLLVSLQCGKAKWDVLSNWRARLRLAAPDDAALADHQR